MGLPYPNQHQVMFFKKSGNSGKHQYSAKDQMHVVP
jgi:hypothetical protein